MLARARKPCSSAPIGNSWAPQMRKTNTLSVYSAFVVFIGLNVLSQFFLRGTHLRQLSDEYELIDANITTTNAILTQKAGDLPDLKETLDVAQREYDDGLKAEQLRGKQAQLRIELAWAHCDEKEKVLSFL